MSDTTERPIGDRAERFAELNVANAQIRISVGQTKSKFSPNARQKSADTNSRLIMTEEFYEK